MHWRLLRGRTREAQVALATSWFAVLCLLLQASVSLLSEQDSTTPLGLRVGGVVLTVAVAVAFVVVQVLVMNRSVARARWIPLAAVPSTLALTYLGDWAMIGVTMALVLILLPFPRALYVTLVIYLLSVVGVLASTGDLNTRFGVTLASVLAAGVLYTLTRLVVVLTELRVTLAHVARLEVDEERHRISRDLHDILGRTLVATSLRQQTALRLLGRDPALAREQLEAAHETVAAGQAQLRGLTSGPVIVGLTEELASVQALCERLGIACEVTQEPVADRDVQQLVAKIVRESVTNMLKHSRPRGCWISVRDEDAEIVVIVANDGCPPPAEVDSRGTGLDDLRARCQAQGGSLEAKAVRGGRFRVLARLPQDHLTPQGGRP